MASQTALFNCWTIGPIFLRIVRRPAYDNELQEGSPTRAEVGLTYRIPGNRVDVPSRIFAPLVEPFTSALKTEHVRSNVLSACPQPIAAETPSACHAVSFPLLTHAH
jgi:hypothetical protein